MDIQRYKWPAFIAASLHGALFLISSEPRMVVDPPIIEIPLAPPPTLEPLVNEPEEPGEPGVAPASNCVSPPLLPDELREPANADAFRVPVTPHAPTPYKVADLGDFRGLPEGITGGTGPIGRPAIPGVDKLDRRPRAMVQGEPAYPETLRRDGINGSVTVEFIVDMDGRVVKAGAVKWSHREFVEPAVRAVLRWRFEPGTVSGRKVSFRMAVPIEFKATD